MLKIKNKNIAYLIMGSLVMACATDTSQVTQVNPVDMNETPPIYDKPKYPMPDQQNLAQDVSASRSEIAKNTLDVKPVYFGFNSVLINAYASKRLEDLATDLKVFENIDKVVIEGHTDEVGSESYNLDLGLRRAIAVKDYLVFHGVNPDRLNAVTMGEAVPAINKGEDARVRKNRRVEITIPNVSTPSLSFNY